MSTLPFSDVTSRRPALDRTRELFRSAGYEPGPIQELLRAPGILLFAKIDVPVHERRLAGDESLLATLIRLFLVDLPVAPAVAEHALGAAFEDLDALGFLMEEDGALRGALRIVPYEGLLIASDNPRVDAGPDHVAGIHGPSGALASLTVRRPVARALDVGTGNGVQALLVARHADRVVATDINERALAFAALNGELNGIDNVELRAGSFLEPVAGERFDLVVANPPYVISPESEYSFRDSGLGRDRVSESLVRALPALLADDASPP